MNTRFHTSSQRSQPLSSSTEQSGSPQEQASDAPVVVDFTGGAAGADIAHRPEIGGFTHAINPLRGDVHVFRPVTKGVIVIHEHGVNEPLGWQFARPW